MTEEATATMANDRQEASSAATSEQTSEAAEKKAAKKKAAKKKAQDHMWAFPSLALCPRCGATDTVAYSTYSTKTIGRQYRRCVRAVCRHRFSVNGKRVAIKKAEAK